MQPPLNNYRDASRDYSSKSPAVKAAPVNETPRPTNLRPNKWKNPGKNGAPPSFNGFTSTSTYVPPGHSGYYGDKIYFVNPHDAPGPGRSGNTEGSLNHEKARVNKKR